MDSPKKKRKQTGQHFATKKPRLHEEAINRYQVLNAEKAQEKARKTYAPKLPWTKAVSLFLVLQPFDTIGVHVVPHMTLFPPPGG